MADYGQWWTAPAESEDGRLIMVTGREDVGAFRSNPRFTIRVEVTWPYEAEASGMPYEATSTMMEEVQDALQEVLHKDPVAVMTGIFTGAGERTMVFYTLSTHIFNKKLNEALAPFPLLPLQITAENDPSWEAYSEMTLARVD
ncbi:MAG: DUF695 domain-containing protein [Bacteroidales bacterium]|nr:DUF695 domain-containing protein [Bacteroidales bacterium]